MTGLLFCFFVKVLVQHHMHCSIVSHFNNKFQRKQLTSLVSLFRTLSVSKTKQWKTYEFLNLDKLWDIPFFRPKCSKQHPNLLGVRSFFKSQWTQWFWKKTMSLKKYWINEKLQKLCFLQTFLQNIKIFQKFWKQKLRSWMTTQDQNSKIVFQRYRKWLEV